MILRQLSRELHTCIMKKNPDFSLVSITGRIVNVCPDCNEYNVTDLMMTYRSDSGTFIGYFNDKNVPEVYQVSNSRSGFRLISGEIPFELDEIYEIAYNREMVPDGNFVIDHKISVDNLEPVIRLSSDSEIMEIGLYSKTVKSHIIKKQFSITTTEIEKRFDDFNVIMKAANAAVLSDYCLAKFLEASAYLVSDENNRCDGKVDKKSFKAVYAKDTLQGRHTIIATVADDYTEELAFNIQYIESPWLEDLEMTPYIHMTAKTALEFANVGDQPSGMHITLRHIVYPGVIEPHYIFGSSLNYTTVGVFSGKVESNVN